MEAHVPRAPVTFASGSPLALSLLGDERLARLVGGGSERAFAALYERYHQPLYRYCRSILRDDSDAQDALQSALASALAALQRGPRDAPVRPWLFRIAHNEAVSLLRRRRPTVELSDADERPAQSVEDRAGERERLRLLVADLGELPECQRGALLMRELSGLSHKEIALALHTSLGATKQAIFEARRALKDCEHGRAMACDDVLRTVSDGDGRTLRGRRVRAHLRDCAACAAAIPARRSDLQALAPPLAPLAAVGVLARLTGAGTGHSVGVGAGGAAVGAAGKSAAAVLATKALVAAAILTTATVGITSALHHARAGRGTSPAARSLRAAPLATAKRSTSVAAPRYRHRGGSATSGAGGYHRARHTPATAATTTSLGQTQAPPSVAGFAPAPLTPTHGTPGVQPGRTTPESVPNPGAHPTKPAIGTPGTAPAATPTTPNGGSGAPPVPAHSGNGGSSNAASTPTAQAPTSASGQAPASGR